MTRIAISGVPGRLASAVAAGVADADDLELATLYNPRRGGESFMGLGITAERTAVSGDIAFEATEPDVVMENLQAWRSAGMHAVVGTSGFTRERIAELRRLWGGDGPGCLVVPNFSIGAVLMMRFAEQAAPHFRGIEIIERHHHDKPDAPSGTAIATANRIAAAGGTSFEESEELVAGSRGGRVGGVRVHSVRMEATLSEQEVAFSKAGEILSITHRGVEYGSFVDGALLAMRYVGSVSGVEVGLDRALDWAASHT
jgi:4-hydroxy-tetrahydrodipicolinate reductase